MTEKESTHFGFETISASEKADRVRAVFDSVATRYDLMNDLMSFGVHRLWKRAAVELAGVRPGQKILDLASGTGDLAARFAGLTGPEGLVVMTDINAAMLSQGRVRMADEGWWVTWSMPRSMPNRYHFPKTALTASPSPSGCVMSPTSSRH